MGEAKLRAVLRSKPSLSGRAQDWPRRVLAADRGCRPLIASQLVLGSWVVLSGAISPVTWVIIMVALLITLLITTHEPPSKRCQPFPDHSGIRPEFYGGSFRCQLQTLPRRIKLPSANASNMTAYTRCRRLKHEPQSQEFQPKPPSEQM